MDGDESIDDFDMQIIGNFLSFASRGDKVGLNQMLREGCSPNVQDYDKRTALHLAASEGHASIVELLLHYSANVNLQDRWRRTKMKWELVEKKKLKHKCLLKCLREATCGKSPLEIREIEGGKVVVLAEPLPTSFAFDILAIPEVEGDTSSRFLEEPLTDARLYGHRDICRILEVNGGMDFLNDHSLTFPHERGINEVNIDLSELNLKHSSILEQGLFGESEKVKWRGTWVAQTRIKRHIHKPVELILSAKDSTLLRELRHPNIVQFLGSIVQEEEMILITEYLSRGNLHDILLRKVRFDFATSVRYALDIARGMNYLHEHKPNPLVHNNLSTRNLLQDEGGHLKIGEYWVHMLYERIHPNQDDCQLLGGINCNTLHDVKKDIYLFANIFYQMLEGGNLLSDTDSELAHLNSGNFEPKFKLSRCPVRIQELIKDCRNVDPSRRPTFAGVIGILEEASIQKSRNVCRVC